MIRRTVEQKIFYYQQSTFYQKRIAELETAEEKVCWLLYKHEHLRDCDKCLIVRYWSEIDEIDLCLESLNRISPDTIHALTSSETIRRVRQHIQNDLGFFLPTSQEVIEGREINQDATRQWIVNQRKLNEF